MTYEQSVKTFAPYEKIQDEKPGIRDPAKTLIEKSGGGSRPSFVFVNNRLEDNAPMTIAGIVKSLNVPSP